MMFSEGEDLRFKIEQLESVITARDQGLRIRRKRKEEEEVTEEEHHSHQQQHLHHVVVVDVYVIVIAEKDAVIQALQDTQPRGASVGVSMCSVLCQLWLCVRCLIGVFSR
jgi:hypothetical protein